MTIVGTRPEIIRLSQVIKRLDECTDHIFVHTGQNYDYYLNEIFFDDLELRTPDYYLDAVNEKSSLGERLGNIISACYSVIDKHKPDGLLVLGDTNSAMSVLAAKRLKVPIFHMEAGNRCFDDRVPEEINRRIVDHTSDINLPYSGIAREYLLREGLPPDRVIKIGSPMTEVLNAHRGKIKNSEILNKLNLKKGNFFVVSFHREENLTDQHKLNSFLEILETLQKKYLIPIIVSTHPRTRKEIKDIHGFKKKDIHFLNPLGFSDYINLQINSKAVLSDSGTITEEASILSFSAVNLRETHERPEGMEEASVMLAGVNCQRVLQALEMLEQNSQMGNDVINKVSDYRTQNVSEKVCRIIHSYVDYVNRNVWKKY